MSTWESGNGIGSASVWNNGLLITISNTLHNTSNVFLCQKQFGKDFRSLENNFIIWIAKMPQSTGLKQSSPCWWTIDTVLITDLMWPLSFSNWTEWQTKSHDSPHQCCGVCVSRNPKLQHILSVSLSDWNCYCCAPIINLLSVLNKLFIDLAHFESMFNCTEFSERKAWAQQKNDKQL